MYSEVLKLLGVKKHPARYQPNDPRFTKRRYGSMSSLPSSSVSSRPIRDKRRANEDRKKVRDIRGINKRFQRLESHVVTLARSVAHLSSEMRTQHLMIQEMENIRSEIAALRTQTNMLNVRSQNAARAVSSRELPVLANPARVRKLTKFFGDEPPLLRLFLRKLGYEVHTWSTILSFDIKLTFFSKLFLTFFNFVLEIRNCLWKRKNRYGGTTVYERRKVAEDGITIRTEIKDHAGSSDISL